MDSLELNEVEVKNRASLIRSGLIIPLLLLVLYAPWSGQIDRWLSHQFYHEGRFQNSLFLEIIYHYAIIPGWILAGAAAIGLIFSLVFIKFRKQMLIYVYLLLTLGWGSGIIVHALLKENWGRPRPRQTIEFGGTQPFLPFYKPSLQDRPEPSKSFSCGHCTMGFYFFSLIFLGVLFHSRKVIWLGLGLSLLLGGLLGYARIAQGGHFLSDVIVSALVMWWTALILYYWLTRHRKSEHFFKL